MKRVCVYCGSSPGARPDYRAAAKALARELVQRDIALVYGGASVGVMGEIADEVLSGGGEVIGIIPRKLLEHEVAHAGLTDLHVVESMHERKALMVELSDGFIAQPGGLGTLDELFEVLTWAQLGFHSKPVGLMNVAGYFDPLLAFLDHSVEERFVKPVHRDLLLQADTATALLEEMATYVPSDIDKWLDRQR